MEPWEEIREFSLVFPDGSRVKCDDEQSAIDWLAQSPRARVESRIVKVGPWEPW